MAVTMRRMALVLALALAAIACSSDAAEVGGTPSSSDSTTAPSGTDAPSSSIVATGETPTRERGVAPDPDPTPIEPSDEIRIGVLENGLTYYVLSNDSPGSSVSMRLVVRAGGYQEDPIGTGVAHFLEHMMFNGTEAYPGNDVDAVLRSIGAEIGPDFNAYTSPTETVYQIEVQDRGSNVDTAFDVLAQWAASASLDPAEVAAEAPIVREELRVRDETGDGLIQTAFEEAYFDGSPFEGVKVGGTEASINDTTPEVLRNYYDTWYRPDNMAVIAVGDRSLDDLESLIVDRFEALEARGQILPADVPEVALRTEPLVDVIVEPSFGDSFISVDVPFPEFDLGTVGGQEQLVIDILIGVMIDERLRESVQSGRLDLRRAGGGYFTFTRGLSYMGFNADADDLEAGTEAFMTELEASIDSGFTQGELDRAIDVWRSIQDQRLATAGTLQDGDLANALVEHYMSGGDISDIEDSVDLNQRILDELDLDEVNNKYLWAMTHAAPIVLVVGPNEERVGDPANHLAAIERARQAEFGAFVDDVAEISELMDRPDAVEEIARNGLDRSPGVELEFANGMRVLFSHSNISEGEVNVVTESPGGRAVLGDSEGAVAPALIAAVDAGGLGPHSSVQVRRFLSALDAGMVSYIADYTEGFSGSAATDDLEVAFQLLHLSVTAPTVEEVTFAQQIEFARDVAIDAGLDSSLAADTALSDARTGGGALAAVPTIAELDALEPADALRVYKDRFSVLDDHVVIVVGDVDEDVVVDLARRYIGSLPGTDSIEAPTVPARPGSEDVRIGVGSGTANGAFRLLLGGTGDETIENRVLAELADSLLNDRLFTVIREELGATYGGFATIQFEEPGDGMELFVSIDGDPDRIDEIADAVDRELDKIAGGTIDQTDFAEAVAVLESRYNFISNGFIIESLFDEAHEPSASRVLDRRAQFDALRGISRSELAAFIGGLVSDTDRIDVRNVPSG